MSMQSFAQGQNDSRPFCPFLFRTERVDGQKSYMWLSHRECRPAQEIQLSANAKGEDEKRLLRYH